MNKAKTNNNLVSKLPVTQPENHIPHQATIPQSQQTKSRLFIEKLLRLFELTPN